MMDTIKYHVVAVYIQEIVDNHSQQHNHTLTLPLPSPYFILFPSPPLPLLYSIPHTSTERKVKVYIRKKADNHSQ